MKTNKRIWKLTSVVIALAMVVGLLPSGLLGGVTQVKAVSVGDEMFEDFTSWSDLYVSTEYSWGTSNYGWGGGDFWDGDSYEYGRSYIDWDTGSSSGYAYYLVDSMPAGTYTLSCNVTGMNIGSTSSGVITIYPYIGGSQVTSYYIQPSASTTWSTSATISNGEFSYTFTLDEDQTSYAVGFYVTVTTTQETHLCEWSLTCDSLSGSSSDDGDDDDDNTDTTETTTATITYGSSNVAGDFEDNTLSTSVADTTESGFYVSDTSYVTQSESGNTTDGGSLSARMTVASDSSDSSGQGGMGGNTSSSYTLYYGSGTSAYSSSDQLSQLTSVSNSATTSATSLSFTFTAASDLQYLTFATMAVNGSSSSGPGGNSSTDTSTYAYLYGYITGLSDLGAVDNEFTVTFNYTLVSESSSSNDQGGMGGNNNNSTSYYYCIDDVVITYEVAASSNDDDTETVISIPSETYYALNCDDFSSDWVGVQNFSTTSISTSASYAYAGYYSYLHCSSAMTTIGYYDQLYNLAAGDYTFSIIADGYLEVYPILYYADGTYVSLEDAKITISTSSWCSSSTTTDSSYVTSATVALAEDYTNVYVGVYLVNTSWADATCISFYYGTDDSGDSGDDDDDNDDDEEATVLSMPGDTTYATYDNDFSDSSEWTLSNAYIDSSDIATYGISSYDHEGNSVTYYCGIRNYSEIYDDGGDAYAYYNQLYYLTEDTYYIVKFFAQFDTSYSKITPALFDENGDLLYTFDDYEVTESPSSWSGDLYEAEIDLSTLDDYTVSSDTAVYVGVYLENEAGGWFTITGFSWYYSGTEESATLELPRTEDDTYIKYGITESDFSSNWKFTNSAYQYSMDDDGNYYQFNGYDNYYNISWYEEDDGSWAAYEYGYAYYNQAFLLVGDGDGEATEDEIYTIQAYVFGEDYAVYPMIYYDGTAYPLTEYALEGIEQEYDDDGYEVYGWSDVVSLSSAEISLSAIEEALGVDDITSTEVYVGLYIENVSGDLDWWTNITGLSFYYGSYTGNIYDDTPDNGGFEDGLSSWTIESDNIDYDAYDTEYPCGYLYTSSAAHTGDYSLNVYSDEADEYTVTISEYIRLTEERNYYLALSTCGVLDSGSIVATVTLADESEVDQVDGAELSFVDDGCSGEYIVYVSEGGWDDGFTEYVYGLDNDDSTATALLDDEDEGYVYSGFYPEVENTIVLLTITITVGAGDWVYIDDILFVSDDYTGTEEEYYGIDQFGDGSFDEADWLLYKYWQATDNNEENDESEDVVYYAGIYGTEVDGTDPSYAAWNNDADSGHTFEIDTKIYISSTADYYITYDSLGYLFTDETGSTATITVTYTDENGDTVTALSEAITVDDNSDSEEWESETTSNFSVPADTMITVTITISFGAATEYTGDDDDTYTTDSYIALDNFVLNMYYESGNGTYTSVYYDGEYINGGDYVKGVDLSSIISLEAAGTSFVNDGDIFEYLADIGVNSIRIRVWVNPYDTSGNTYGGGTNDADVAIMIAERCADAGLGVMLSFHLSDFWADPSYQVSPKEWSSYTTANKASAAVTHVTETVDAVLETGANLQFVTIGNETYSSSTSTYLAGSGSSSNQATIIGTVAQALDGYDLLVGIHTAPTNYNSLSSNASTFYNSVMSSYGSYIDFFGISCYPYWTSHGSTTNDMSAIAATLANFVSTYSKPVMIMEYNWPYVLGDDQDDSLYDGYSQSTTTVDGVTYIVTGEGGYYGKWDVSRDGQADMIEELNEYFATYSGLTGEMIGSYYWEPAWISAQNSTSSWSTSRVAVWYEYGCGVATVEGANYEGWSGYDDTSDSRASGSATDEYSLFTVSGTATAGAYALNFVDDAEVITSPLAQITTSADSDGCYSIRFIALFDSDVYDMSTYDTVGFKIEYASADGNSVRTLSTVTSTVVYSEVKVNGTLTTATSIGSSYFDSDDYNYLYSYVISGIPSSGTYYFKVIPVIDGTYAFQEAAGYYVYEDGTLSTCNAWDYTGYNDDIDCGMDSYTVYPSYLTD